MRALRTLGACAGVLGVVRRCELCYRTPRALAIRPKYRNFSGQKHEVTEVRELDLRETQIGYNKNVRPSRPVNFLTSRPALQPVD